MPEQITIPVGGMTCAACQAHVQRALASLRRKAIVACVVGAISMILSVPLMGLGPVHSHTADPLLRFFMAVVDPVLKTAAPGIYAFEPTILRWVLMLLTVVVMTWAGGGYYTRAWRTALHGTTNMSTLIALGTGAAFLYSAAVTLNVRFFTERGLPLDVYFEVVNIILALVLLGSLLEARAKRRTTSALRSLIALQPPTMLTGEAIPVVKAPGDVVTGGTQNGNESVLSRIVGLMREAQNTRPPVQRLADRVSAVFVPVVVAIAVVSCLLWLLTGAGVAMAMTVLVSVLIMGCPCALGLAVPTAVVVATGRAAEFGLLVRGGEAFETLRRADVIVLDKTGTLTEGKPIVVGVHTLAGVAEADLLGYAAAVERGSEHPLASAIIEAAHRSGAVLVEAREFNASPGSGVSAVVGGRRVWAGNERFLADNGIDTTQLQQHALIYAAEGKTPVLVAIGSQPAGVLAIADPLRPGSAEAVRQLREMGLRVVMLTGDRQETAGSLAREAGIDEVIAGVLPAGKVEAVKQLQKQGLTVVMAGDGINDAPALTQADASLALGTGADIATNAADITLMRADLRAVVDAIRISRRTMRIMKQNLFWAFAYNVLGIPIAAGILYPAFGILLSPMLASAAMAVSSVSVVTNSLRLRTVSSARDINTRTAGRQRIRCL